MTYMASFKIIIIYFLYIQHCFAKDNNTEGPEHVTSSNNKTELENHTEIASLYSTPPPSDNKEILRITVYYETLCPGSMEFFVTSLAPVAVVLGPYIHVHMVPYGHVKEETVGDDKELQCQHGPIECRGNKIHACVVDVIKNNTEAVLFNSCLVDYTIDNYPSSYDTALDSCGDKRKANISEIKSCLNSSKSDILFKTYGEETEKFYKLYNGDRPVKQYVPYVVFENQGLNNTKDQKNDDFMFNVCDALQPRPKECDV